MSTFVDVDRACLVCGAAIRCAVASSVNVSRSPHHRERLLAGEFHRFPCTQCGAALVVETAFTYVDFERAELTMVFAPSDEPRWASLEPLVLALHMRNFACAETPELVRQIGARFRLRTVFGLAALREKVLLYEAQLDDLAIELTKLAWMRDGALDRLAPEARPRVCAIHEDHVRLESPAGAHLALLTSELRARSIRGEPLAEQLGRGSYVDVGRFLWPEA